MTAFDPGAVHLTLDWAGGRIRGIDLRLSRPNAAALLVGRPAAEAACLLPMLYSICGVAQGAAAALALRAAHGEEVAATVDARVQAEARREHLWRLLLDWPRALGLAEETALLAEGRRQLAAGGFDAWAPALDEPYARLEAALLSAGDLPPGNERLLPSWDAAQSVAECPRLDAAFAAAPAWQGRPAETGPLARHGDLVAAPPLLARLRARRADLLAPRGLGAASAAPAAPGVGRAAVETARGLLLHELALDGERVAAYAIVAPTEWNFRPQGTLAAWLAGMVAASPQAARAAAGRAVLALDPCVRCDIVVTGAA